MDPVATMSSQVGPAAAVAAPKADEKLAPEIRALGALLGVDALVGLWLAANAPQALQAYLAPQIPAIGIGGLVWGFLPDGPKDSFGHWLSRQLARPMLIRVVIGLGGVLFVSSLFVSTISVRSVDPDVATNVYAMRGSQIKPDTSVLRPTKPKRLNRLTTPIKWFIPVLPVGSRVWVHTNTHVVSADHHATPWIPTALDYPDDFTEMVTLALLPDDTVWSKLADRQFQIEIIHVEDSSRVAHGKLGEHGVYVGFLTPAVDDSARALARTRWKAWLAEHGGDGGDADEALMIRWEAFEQQWAEHRWIRARRPMQLGDSVVWEVRGPKGVPVKRDTIALDRRVTDVHLAL